MRAEDDDAVLGAGKAHDEVAQVHRADGRIGEERVFFQVVVLEVVAQEGLRLDVARAGGPARANGDKLAGVVVGAGSVEMLRDDGSRKKRENRDEQREELGADVPPAAAVARVSTPAPASRGLSTLAALSVWMTT